MKKAADGRFFVIPLIYNVIERGDLIAGTLRAHIITV